MNDDLEYLRNFRRRVVRMAAGLTLVVCASSALLGYGAVALGFGFGSAVSIAGFSLAVSKSLKLLCIGKPSEAAAYSFKWFLPRFLLYGLALLIGARYSWIDFASVVAGILLCNAILVLYEPIMSRFSASTKRGSGVFSGEI
ncbi:MAG: hypothetical protein JW759_03005 [Candidatus Coatesbacteria bacterium]|nr:hypothetical protein [Candidatus Coatesbacteria bacterium]